MDAAKTPATADLAAALRRLNAAMASARALTADLTEALAELAGAADAVRDRLTAEYAGGAK